MRILFVSLFSAFILLTPVTPQSTYIEFIPTSSNRRNSPLFVDGHLDFKPPDDEWVQLHTEMEDTIVATTLSRIYFLSSSQPFSILRWEWITDTSNDWGGVVDDTPTALIYSPKLRLLFIGNDLSLSTFNYETGFFSRIGADEGLPVNNITSLAIDEEKSYVYIGTKSGLVLFEPLTNTFRYFAGPRYLVDNYVLSVSVDQTTHVCSISHQGGGKKRRGAKS